jgi:UDP-N-acetyl-D-mannosaminuronic acid dehydrogenase
MLKEISVIGGAGHVGLAFSLICASNNIKVHLHDINSKSLNMIKNGKMPHKENGAQKILKKALKKNLLSFSDNKKDLKLNNINVICIGTPIDEFLNPQYKIILTLINDLLKIIKNGQHFIIRSTVYPGTTDFLHKYLKNKNKKIKLSFCPERFVQGSAIVEFKKTPQIIGSVDNISKKECTKFFKQIAKEVIFLKPIEAELTKLFLNSFRYIVFAIANQFYTISDSLNIDYSKIDHAMRSKYPRGKNIPTPGFTSGPCLFKDTMQLYSFAQDNFSLGINAMTINEGIVNYIVDKLKKKYDLSKKTIGILGMSFKADIDDSRSSLSYKLKKMLMINAKNVITTDPYVKNDKEIISLDETIKSSDILILATPHKAYKKIKTKKPLIDIWNIIKK